MYTTTSCIDRMDDSAEVVEIRMQKDDCKDKHTLVIFFDMILCRSTRVVSLGFISPNTNTLHTNTKYASYITTTLRSSVIPSSWNTLAVMQRRHCLFVIVLNEGFFRHFSSSLLFGTMLLSWNE